MERAIWKGYITFGLVNIPVSLISAEINSAPHLHMLDKRNQARVHYQIINNETDEVVPRDQIVKAFEYEKENYVVLTDEELKQVAIEATQTIDIINFVDKDAVGNEYFIKPYFLMPEKKGEKGYVLLREALRKTNKIGIAKVVIRTRQHLAALMAYEDALLLELLRYSDEVHSVEEYNFPNEGLSKYKITEQEIKLSEQLIQTMVAEWDPSIYHDDYRTALMQVVEEKLASKTGEIPSHKKPKLKAADNVIDFVSIIKKSLEEKSGKSAKKKVKRHGS